MIACLVPPSIVLNHKAPYLLFGRGSEPDEAFVLGVLSSVPLDWYARRIVEINVTFGILNAFPIPTPTVDDPRRIRVIEIAGILAAIDDRYGEWAAAVGIERHELSSIERDELVYELDAVVAHLYGLEESEVVHIFETFHEGWDYEPRLKRVLAHYREWE